MRVRGGSIRAEFKRAKKGNKSHFQKKISNGTPANQRAMSYASEHEFANDAGNIACKTTVHVNDFIDEKRQLFGKTTIRLDNGDIF